MDSIDNDGILAVDIGTTNLKCALFDKNFKILNIATLRLDVLRPFEEYFEINPEHLFDTLKKCLHMVLDIKKPVRIKSFGISTQRNSFLLWNRNSGKKYTNFILWADKRNKNTCKQLNSSLLLNTVTSSAKLTSKIFHNHHIKLLSNYKVDLTHIGPKLINQLEILGCKLETEEFNQLSYGTIETWLVWMLSKEKLFVTDLSCACTTGIYDVFQKSWSTGLLFWFGIPNKILPIVKDTCDDFGHLEQSIIDVNYSIPIRAIVADAQASCIAECCFYPGDCVITIGTGSFISVVVGDKPISSNFGNFPLAAYKFKNETLYILHCFVTNAGQNIDWARSIGLFDDYKEIDQVLKNTPDSGGVYFIPSLLEMPGIDKSSVGSGFYGLKSNTTKNQMLRAVIESIAYTLKLKMDCIRNDLKINQINLTSIRVSGGVTNSKEFCQLLTNLLEFPTERSNFSHASSCYGAAFLAGLSANLFDKLDDLHRFRRIEIEYMPNEDEIKKQSNYLNQLKNWQKVLKIFSNWNQL